MVPLVLVVAMVVLFSARLFDLQVLSAAALNEEASGRRGVVTSLWSTRGAIVDAEGQPLATSVDRFDITISPVNMADLKRPNSETGEEEVTTVEQVFERLATITGQDAGQLRAEVDAILEADPEANFAYVARMVSLEQYQEIRAMRVPWIYPQPHPKRSYPAGSVAGNLVGFTGSDGEPLAGLELQYNDCLAGVDGQEMYERSADGVAIPGTVVTVEQPQPGGTLELTIDSDTQYRVQQILAEQVRHQRAESGTITVVRIKTGEVVAAAEYPTVDPNVPGEAKPEDRGNRTFGAAHEPGSTMKPITAAMLYDAGVINTTETVTVPDRWDENGAVFSDHYSHGPVEMNMHGILATSSNVGLATFGERLPAEQRYEYMTRFGFGERTAVGFNGEAPGTLRSADQWDQQTSYTVMFGQGMTATTAQMVSAYQALGNGGVRLPLQLVRGCRDSDGNLIESPKPDPVTVVSPEAARSTLDGMEAMSVEPWAVDQLAVPGYRVATKTGTAQLVDPETGQYYPDTYYASLAGVAPANDPEYVVVVAMVRPTRLTGAEATIEAWQQSMSYVLSANNVPPSPQPWPEFDARH